MDEEFDNILKNRIREVFDNFDEPSADEGWLQLRKKFPEEQTKRRAIAWLWWGSAAAVLLLFLGIGLFINNNQPIKPEKLTGSKIKTPEPGQKNLASAVDHHDKKDTPEVVGKKKSAIFQITNKPSSKSKRLIDHRLFNHPQTNHPALDNDSLSTDTSSQNLLAGNVSAESNKIVSKKAPENTPTVVVPLSNSSTDTPVVPDKAPSKSIDAMFAKDQAAEVKNDEKEKNKNKKVHFGVYAATYFNYAKGSDNQVNLGGGITSDIKLSKNLKFVTGVAIGQNSLNYNINAPQAILANGDRLVRNAGLYRAVNPSANTATPVTPPTAFKSYNASLMGLDIPLNLKYEINPLKSDAYILAGLSSGTFINESYTYHYAYPAVPSLTQQDATTRANFNTFYFAKTLDVAFGVGYPFGKNTRLVIEPFLKYPLQSLGSQQIRFGSGGLNLKLNFQTSKK